MLPWLVISLIGLWALSQLLPPDFRFEITYPRLACVFVLLVTLFCYEILMPQLSAWRVRRNWRPRKRKRFEAIELQKLRKTATRRCRNCLNPYRDQKPVGGRFMCSYCGHISKRPVLDLPVPPGLGIPNAGIIKDPVGKGGKILNGKGWSENGWMCGQDWLENGNRGAGSVAGKSSYWRKNGSGVFGGDEDCLAEKSYSGVVIFVCKLLTSFFLSIRWLWRKIFRVSSSSDDASSDADHRGMLTKSGENGTSFHESRGEKARRKAEEKRQARLEKELLEEEERKQREEVARLVEERRRQRDEKLEAEKDRSKLSPPAREKEIKKEAEKKRQERRKEKDKASSKSNSDAEELEKRAGKETDRKRDTDKKNENDCREHQKSGTDNVKGNTVETGYGMKNTPAIEPIFPLLDTSSNSSSPVIFRVPNLVGFKEPSLVSFGPYHKNKNLLLEKCKYSFLEKFLSRTRNQGKDLCFYVQQMMTLEWPVRRCYSEDLSLPSSEFVEMMLVDSCFIMEVLYHFGGSEEESGNEVFPLEPWQIPIVVSDLLLLENQIPFFVLEKLFDLSKSEEGTETVSVSTMALKVFNVAFPGSMDFSCKFNHLEDVPKHLLDLLLKTIRPSNPSTDYPSLFLKTIHLKATVLLNSVFSLLFPNHRRDQMRFSKKEDDMLQKPPATSSKQKEYEIYIQSKLSTSKSAKFKKVSSLESAGELRRSGIEFRPGRADRLTDIHFKDGVLEIPPITINDLFITILVNCVAFEQHCTGCSQDLTAYVSFLSGLLRYPSDIESLSSDGIISRFSDENERVASSFNYLRSMVSDLDILGDSYLYKIITETEGYYTGNRVMTWLRYFWRDPRILLFCITSLWFAFVLI